MPANACPLLQREGCRKCFNPKGQQTLHGSVSFIKGIVSRVFLYSFLQVSGKINFNFFGPNATLFLKKQGQNNMFISSLEETISMEDFFLIRMQGTLSACAWNMLA
jgi:hypothetical protein